MNEQDRSTVKEPGIGEVPPAPAESPEQAMEARARRSALFIVFLVVFIDLLGFGIVLPLLPLYAEDFLKPLLPGEDQEKWHGVILGVLMASFSAMQFLFAPIWGRISDRIGRRPILLLGLLGSVVFYTLFGIASELGAAGWPALGLALFFLARLGAGLSGATISTAQAVIADSTSPERRSRGMALIGAAFGIGFTFGPLLGFSSLFIDRAGAPGFMAAAISLVAFVLAVRLLPETLRTTTTGLRRNWLDWRSMQEVLRTPSIGILIITFFLATFAFGGLESTLAVLNKALLQEKITELKELTREALKTTERSNFLIFAYVGLVLMVVQGVFYRRLAGKVSEVTFMRIGSGLMALGLSLAAWLAWLAYRDVLAHGLWILLWALPVMTVGVVGFAFLTPSVQALISRRSDPAKQGEILGVNQSASALARIFGPFVGLSLFKLEPSHVLPYILGALLLVLVFSVTFRIR
jgi:MFS family permease